MLKIIGGNRRGAKLCTLEGEATRPLRGRVREALFSILQADLADARVLDLFAGSGAVGLEALSRGAALATFVESLSQATTVIRRNVDKLRYENEATIIAGRLPGALRHLPKIEGGYTLVFLMPPYHTGVGWKALEVLASSGLLAPDAVVVHEIEATEEFELPAGWRITGDRKYGVTRLLFLAAA